MLRLTERCHTWTKQPCRSFYSRFWHGVFRWYAINETRQLILPAGKPHRWRLGSLAKHQFVFDTSTYQQRLTLRSRSAWSLTNAKCFSFSFLYISSLPCARSAKKKRTKKIQRGLSRNRNCAGQTKTNLPSPFQGWFLLLQAWVWSARAHITAGISLRPPPLSIIRSTTALWFPPSKFRARKCHRQS